MAPQQRQISPEEARAELLRRGYTEEQIAEIMGGAPGPPTAGSQPAQFAGGVARGFMANQPIQDPRAIARGLSEAGPFAAAFGPLVGQAQALSSGVQAARPESILQDPTGSFMRLANIPLSLTPYGAAVSQEVIEPMATGLSVEPTDQSRAGEFGYGVGAGAGMLSDLVLQPMIGSTLRSYRQGRAAAQAAETGIPESLGRRPGAGSFSRATESVVSKLPGGRKVIEEWRANQQRLIVERGINRTLEGMADFTGPKIQLVTRIQNAADNVIETLRQRNQVRYQAFDDALMDAHQRLGMRRPPSRAEAARGMGSGEEVTAMVPAGQAGASVPGAAPSGIRVTSFTGDAVADVADELMSRVGAERLLVRDPSLEGLVDKVKRLTKVRGRQVPVTTAANARSTLLALNRRLDNPLGSKEGNIVGRIFDPIDAGIEGALLEAGGESLVNSWRTANAGVKRAHQVIDDTLFEQVANMRDPENIAAAFQAAPRIDLRRMKRYLEVLDPQRWDQVRTLILRDELAKTIQGESAIPARQGGKPLRISLDPKSNVRVTGNLNEAINKIEEAKRSVLLNDDEIARLSQLEDLRGRVSLPDQFASLLGSQLAAATIVGVPSAVLGYATGGIPAATAGAVLGGAGGLTMGARLAAEVITNPQLWDNFMALTKGAAAGGAGASIIGQRLLDSIPVDALAEFIEINNIPVGELPERVRNRLFRPEDPLAQFGLMDMRPQQITGTERR